MSRQRPGGYQTWAQAEDDLRYAAEKGDLAKLKRLVKKGVNVKAAGEWGDTALIMAAMKGKLDCLEYLITKGAKVNARNINKRTALHFAARNGRARCVEALLKAGADARLKDEFGDMAFDDAEKCGKRGRTQVIALLEHAATLAAEEAAARRAAARKAAERAAAERAAALGLLEPLQSLELDAGTLRTAIAAAVAYCDEQGATSVADLVECKLLRGLMASLNLKRVHAMKLARALKGRSVQGLAELLASINLSGHLGAAHAWCVEQGAEDVFDLMDEDDDLAEQLAEHLRLKNIPAKRLVAALRPEA